MISYYYYCHYCHCCYCYIIIIMCICCFFTYHMVLLSMAILLIVCLLLLLLLLLPLILLLWLYMCIRFFHFFLYIRVWWYIKTDIQIAQHTELHSRHRASSWPATARGTLGATQTPPNESWICMDSTNQKWGFPAGFHGLLTLKI